MTKHTFKSKYTFDLSHKDSFVEFYDDEGIKTKGWVLGIEFSGELTNPLITYTIQGYDYINEEYSCYIYECIAEDQIIGTTDIE